MKRLALIGLVLTSYGVYAQTTSLSTGNWSDPTIWDTGVVPPSTATVNVNHSVTIDQNIVVTTGTYNFGLCASAANVGCTTTVGDEYITDNPGGTAYTLTAVTSGGTILVQDGITTFEGAGTLDNVTLTIYKGATLVLGTTQINNQSTINIYGTLIINGDLNNNNNGTGQFNIQTGGLVQVNGNYTASTGNVDIFGGGDIFSTGSMNTTGSSDIFGNTADCATGPCSGRNLCGYTLSILGTQAICNSGAVNASTPAALTSSTSATGTLTYRWQTATTVGGYSNTTSGTPPVATANLAAGTNTASSYTVDPSYYDVTETHYFRLYMYDDNTACGAFSSSVAVVSVASTGWLGTSNAWTSTSNWCNNTVPTSTTPTTVTIGEFPSGTGKFYPTISTTADVRNLTINSNAFVTVGAGATLNIAGNLTTDGTLSANASSTTVFTTSLRAQTIGGISYTNFGNLTINNTFSTAPQISMADNNRTVQGVLTLTSGNVDQAGFTLTVGTSAASTGSLSQSGGWLYGGYLQRYFGTTATSLSNGLFPIGSSSDYRPYSVGYTSGLTSGGYVRASHSGTQYTSTNVSFFDNPPTNSVTVAVRSNSFWTSTSNGISGGGTSFQIEAGGTSFSSPATLSDFRIVRASDVVGTNGTSSNTALDPRIQRTGLTAANLSNTFYVGSVNAATTPLPVNFIDFKGEAVNGQTKLSWSTASESNNDYFTVYHSLDGEIFTSLGKVKGAGTTNTAHEYTLTDGAPTEGRNYYRLSQTDLDGKSVTLKTIAVQVDKVNYITKIYPNPVFKDSNVPMSIEMTGFQPNQSVDMHLVNMQGIILHSYTLKADEQGILSVSYSPGADVAAGLYIIKIGNMRARVGVQ